MIVLFGGYALFGNGLKLAHVKSSALPPPSTDGKLALWNPNVAAWLSLLFSPVFSAWIHALNWKAMGHQGLKRQSFFWVGIVLFFDMITLISGLYGVDLGPAVYLGLCVFWYVNLGNLQAVYVKNHTLTYEKKGWLIPIILGVLLTLAKILSLILVTLLFAIVGNPQGQNEEANQAHQIWVHDEAHGLELSLIPVDDFHRDYGDEALVEVKGDEIVMTS